jgi:hypothetical protein
VPARALARLAKVHLSPFFQPTTLHTTPILTPLLAGDVIGGVGSTLGGVGKGVSGLGKGIWGGVSGSHKSKKDAAADKEHADGGEGDEEEEGGEDEDGAEEKAKGGEKKKGWFG